MPSKMIKTPILPDKYYHIFNQANNNEFIFKEESDYHFFLEKVNELVLKEIDMYSFCLLPNHFHLFIKPKLKANCEGNRYSNESLRKFFQIYVQYYNKKYKRKGSLLLKSFRRVEIKDDFHLKYLIFYIHYNPQKHRIIDDYKKYPFSSYRFFKSGKLTKLQKDEVMNWFDNSLAEFENYHQDCLDRKVGLGTPSLGMESPFFLPLLKSFLL